ncbi:response regulator transcription factor [Flavobacterium humi]|uniref:Response regulator transcription factor n=1 Tax=Flavobacterium humi TaxID=2562683 RepID=A0A4Z0L648_9FLAO|nr:response regulator transcription factor [Flavobacterium humi]TGD56647.1 response regulator transcription factor [Flavobacterium humi]
MSDVIKLILVDDEVLFRKGISFLLEREKNIKIIFEASNGSELIEFLHKTDEHPDIVITDLKMPTLNGVETTKIMHNDFPHIKIIALTSYNTKTFVANMINVGAVSYLMKNTTPQELLTTINEVASKGFYYNDYVMKIIHDNISVGKKTKSNFDTNYLTARETKILQLICEQKNTVEIADQLFISPRTVEGHRNNLLLKTESRNIAGLVVYAIQNEIVVIDNYS